MWARAKSLAEKKLFHLSLRRACQGIGDNITLKSAIIHWKLAAWMVGVAVNFGPGQVVRAQQSSGEIEVLRVRPNFYMIAGRAGISVCR